MTVFLTRPSATFSLNEDIWKWQLTSAKTKQQLCMHGHTIRLKGVNKNTVFDLITAPALITAPPDFLLHFHLLSSPFDDLFPDFLLDFNLSSPTSRSFGTSSREIIYVSTPGAY